MNPEAGILRGPAFQPVPGLARDANPMENQEPKPEPNPKATPSRRLPMSPAQKIQGSLCHASKSPGIASSVFSRTYAKFWPSSRKYWLCSHKYWQCSHKYWQCSHKYWLCSHKCWLCSRKISAALPRIQVGPKKFLPNRPKSRALPKKRGNVSTNFLAGGMQRIPVTMRTPVAKTSNSQKKPGEDHAFLSQAQEIFQLSTEE